MKDKEKQIEEMSDSIFNNEWVDISSYEADKIAEMFTEQGYRKLPKDSVVLSREELSKLRKDYAESERANILCEIADGGTSCHWCIEEHEKIGYEKGSKETSEKIFKWLKKHCDGVGWKIVETYFKEQFNVEIIDKNIDDESFDCGYHEYAKEKHDKRVADTPNRIEFAIKQFEANNIDFTLKNEASGHFHCWRKSDNKLFQFYAGTGKITGVANKRGIHALIEILTK